MRLLAGKLGGNSGSTTIRCGSKRGVHARVLGVLPQRSQSFWLSTPTAIWYCKGRTTPLFRPDRRRSICGGGSPVEEAVYHRLGRGCDRLLQ